MAHKIADVTGAWSTAATWFSNTNTPTIHASTNITIGGSSIFTATFTAPNTTNACAGVLLYINAIGSAGTIAVTLQEATVDTVATVSIPVTSLVAGSWVYFRFPTPYVFTATTAGRYRFKIVNSGGSGTTNGAADSGGGNLAYLAVDDRTGVPASTDDVWIVGQNQATAIVVTMDGSQTIGSGTETAFVPKRSLGNAINVYNLGTLIWDIAASATLTCKGNVAIGPNGTLNMGTVANPVPAAYLARLLFNENGTTGNHGLVIFGSGAFTAQGVAKSSSSLYKCKYVSGVGTAADPLIVNAAVDWSVGDEIVIGPTGDSATNYSEGEFRFIITKNSATSYVVSTTKGGAEAALTYTHTTDAWVLNVERNVLIDTTNTAQAWYFDNQTTVDGSVNLDWARFETIGANVTSKNGFTLMSASTHTADCDYCVVYRALFRGFVFNVSKVQESFTGLISCAQNAPSNFSTVGAFDTRLSPANKTFNDFFAIANNACGFNTGTIVACTFNGFYIVGCNGSNSTTRWAFNIEATGLIFSCTFNNLEIHCSGRYAMAINNLAGVIFNNALIGTKGENVVDLSQVTDGYPDISFLNCSFGSTTFYSGYTAMVAGGEVRFFRLNDTDNNHYWYKREGIGQSTGAGLADTTVRTASSLAVRLAPESSTGFVWEYKILAKADSAVSALGFLRKNAAFGTDDVTVELFLPNSTVADDSVTMPDDTEWNVFNLAASYTGDVNLYATVRITAKSVTSAAYCYIDDLYNGTNKITALDVWNDGKPSDIMFEQLGDAAAVWAVATSTMTTQGTIGNLVANKLLKTPTFIALK